MSLLRPRVALSLPLALVAICLSASLLAAQTQQPQQTQQPPRPNPQAAGQPQISPQINLPQQTSPQSGRNPPPQPVVLPGQGQQEVDMPPVSLPPALPPAEQRKPAAQVSPREALLPCVLAKVLAGITCKDPAEFQYMGPRGDAHIFNGFYGAHFTEYYCQAYPDDTLLITSPAFKKAVYGGKLFFDEANLCLTAEVKTVNCTSAPRQRCCVGPDPEAPKVQQGSPKAASKKKR